MSKMEFTYDQKCIIEARNKNILVSAGAGSGKTAVLIERIFQLIKNKEGTLSKILMITYTKKAAGEMKEKLRSKFHYEISVADKDLKAHLKSEEKLINKCQISTIHSFCNNIIKNQYAYLKKDINPILIKDTQKVHLKSKIFSNLFEEKISSNDENFKLMIEDFYSIYGNHKFQEVVYKIFDFASSQVSFEEFMESLKGPYEINKDNLDQSVFSEFLKKLYAKNLRTMDLKIIQMQKLIDGDASEYLENFEEDRNFLEYLKESLHQGSLEDFIIGTGKGFTRLKSVKKDQKTEDHETFQNIRNALKKEVASLYFDLDFYFEINKEIALYLNSLIEFILEFKNELKIEKDKKGFIDFSDMEEMALYLLSNEEIRNKYKNYFQYIFIDEYQDSNRLQNQIFNYIGNGTNLFFVGDIKQSIYGFRMADSQIFLETLMDYEKRSDSEVFYLSQNFRCTKEIISFVNDLYQRIMKTSKFSSIDYAGGQELVFGSQKYSDYGVSHDTIFSDELKLDLEENYGEDEYRNRSTNYHLECRLVIEKIKKMKAATNCKYSDFAILSRSSKGVIDTYLDEFNKANIPLIGNIDTGFLKSLDINFLVDYLKILNNRFNDVSLLNILTSYPYNYQLEDILRIRNLERQKNLEKYENTCKEDRDKSTLTTFVFSDISNHRDEFARFFSDYNYLKDLFKYSPLSSAIIELLNTLEYFSYISLFEDFPIREGNILEFIKLSKEYSLSSISSLSDFLLYLNKLEKYELDMKESSMYSENSDCVKFLTIHKSKGLEYENVFVVNLGKNFLLEKDSINIHKDLGLGIKKVRDKKSYETLNYYLIKKIKEQESRCEDLNVLYVALTRAKRNLSLISTYKNHERYLKSLENAALGIYKSLDDFIIYEESLGFLKKSCNFMLLDNYELIKQGGALLSIGNNLSTHKEGAETEIKGVSENIPQDSPSLRSENNEQTINRASTTLNLNKHLENLQVLVDLERENDLLKYKATNESKDKEGPRKISVSQVSNGVDNIIFKDYFKESLRDVPRFIGETKGLSAPEKGTIFHQFMENLSFKEKLEDIQHLKSTLEKRKIFTKEELDSINNEEVMGFLDSEIGNRLRNATSVFKEVSFNHLRKIKGLRDETFIQGVIDLYFIENNEIVLLDYKTDFVQTKDEIKNIKKYEEQLGYYKDALEELTKKKVKESVLYFTKIKEFVVLDPIEK